MKLLLVSGSGFLGSALSSGLSRDFEVVATSRGEGLRLDLEQPVRAQILSALEKGGFSHAILCAALSDVERCFREPERSRRINVDGTLELLVALKEFGIQPIFFSSDLIFGGKEGLWREEDPVSPTTLYGRQKLELEREIGARFKDFMIFRTSKLLSKDLHPRSIVSGILKPILAGESAKVFVDQWITPVFVEDVCEVVGLAIRAGLCGTYHLAAPDLLSRYEFAKMVCQKLGLDPARLEAVRMSDLQWSEPRGTHNALDASRISQALNYSFTCVADGLDQLSQARARRPDFAL
jgi:dTDP-4-dehydrorhamnose reductase